MTQQRTKQADLEIGPYLKQLRHGLSLGEIRHYTGVSDVDLARVEDGTKGPDMEMLQKLARLYPVDLDELLERAGHLDDEPASS